METNDGHTEPLKKPGAFAEFIKSRIELVWLEAGTAGKVCGVRLLLVVLALACVPMVWLAAVIGAVGWIAAAARIPWYQVTLGAGGIHLAVIGGIVLMLRKPLPALFPQSKIELSRDRQWISQLKTKPEC